MPDISFLQREVLSGVSVQQVLIGIGVVLLVLTIWNRVARANMKLPGK